MLQLGECRWSKAGKPVGMFGGKYELRGDTGAGDCSLTLHTVDLRIDDGQWQCQVGTILMGDLYGTFDNSIIKEHSAGHNQGKDGFSAFLLSVPKNGNYRLESLERH